MRWKVILLLLLLCILVLCDGRRGRSRGRQRKQFRKMFRQARVRAKQHQSVKQLGARNEIKHIVQKVAEPKAESSRKTLVRGQLISAKVSKSRNEQAQTNGDSQETTTKRKVASTTTIAITVAPVKTQTTGTPPKQITERVIPLKEITTREISPELITTRTTSKEKSTTVTALQNVIAKTAKSQKTYPTTKDSSGFYIPLVALK